MLSPYIAVLVGMYLFQNAFLSLILYHIGMGTAIILFHKKIDFTTLFQVKNRVLASVLITMCGISGFAIYALWTTIQKTGSDTATILASFQLIGTTKIIFLIYFAVIHPLLEEIYWRFLLDAKARFISVQEILFALYHLLVVQFFVQPIYLIYTFVGLVGIARLWRYLKQDLTEHGTIIISHAVADFSIMFFILTLV